MVQGILADGTGTLHATWWNKWIVKKLTIGETMRFSGKVGLYLGQLDAWITPSLKMSMPRWWQPGG